MFLSFEILGLDCLKFHQLICDGATMENKSLNKCGVIY